MTQFWIMAALLIVLALLFVLDPWIRARRHQARQRRLDALRQQQNVAIFRERLAELDAEKAAGILEPGQYEELKAELETNLLSDVQGMDAQAEAREQGSSLRWLTLALVVLVPVVAVVLYNHWGAYEGVKQRQWMTELEQQTDAAGVEALLARLEKSLENDPDNAQSWFMLARTRMGLGQYFPAAEAFLKLARLLENSPTEAAAIYGLRAQALYFASQGRMVPEVTEAISQALKRDSQETNALSLLGIDAFERGDYGRAADYWQRVLDANPEDPNAETIRSGIARARELQAQQAGTAQSGAAEGPAQAGEQTSQERPAAPRLAVSVALAPELAAQASPEDSVFVYARAVSGPPMPLAAVRLRVSELPATVTLDDSAAMGPMAGLSSASQVEVIARVSKQGDVKARPGDLEGSVGPVDIKPGQQEIWVRIERKLP